MTLCTGGRSLWRRGPPRRPPDPSRRWGRIPTPCLRRRNRPLIAAGAPPASERRRDRIDRRCSRTRSRPAPDSRFSSGRKRRYPGGWVQLPRTQVARDSVDSGPESAISGVLLEPIPWTTRVVAWVPQGSCPVPSDAPCGRPDRARVAVRVPSTHSNRQADGRAPGSRPSRRTCAQAQHLRRTRDSAPSRNPRKAGGRRKVPRPKDRAWRTWEARSSSFGTAGCRISRQPWLQARKGCRTRIHPAMGAGNDVPKSDARHGPGATIRAHAWRGGSSHEVRNNGSGDRQAFTASSRSATVAASPASESAFGSRNPTEAPPIIGPVPSAVVEPPLPGIRDFGGPARW